MSMHALLSLEHFIEQMSCSTAPPLRLSIIFQAATREADNGEGGEDRQQYHDAMAEEEDEGYADKVEPGS